jgi:hypothetical protein
MSEEEHQIGYSAFKDVDDSQLYFGTLHTGTIGN